MALVDAVMSPSDHLSPQGIIEHARNCEALGYDAIWITDVFGREIYVTAGWILSHTTTLKVATGIAHIYGRDHIASVQAARTLSELSGGRFIQGVGVSHPVASQMRGVAWEDPVVKARTYIQAMRGPTPVHTPAQAPPVPIYLAAHGPKMLAVAAEVADGANTYMQTPESVQEARRILGPDKVLNFLMPTCLTTDPAAGRAAGRRAISIYLPLPAYQRVWARAGFGPSDWADGGSDRLVDTYTTWGDLDTIRTRLESYKAAGASHIVLGPNSDPARPGSAAELLSALAPGR